METPNEDLAQRVCAALEQSGVATAGEMKKFAAKMIAGRVRPEDWYALIENSLPQVEEGPSNDD